MRFYLLLALLFAALLLLLYMRYRSSHDNRFLLRAVGAIAIALFFTYISKLIIVHRPIFVIHLALLILSWGATFYYILREKLLLWLLLAPAATTLFFLFEALFFREHG